MASDSQVRISKATRDECAKICEGRLVRHKLMITKSRHFTRRSNSKQIRKFLRHFVGGVVIIAKPPLVAKGNDFVSHALEHGLCVVELLSGLLVDAVVVRAVSAIARIQTRASPRVSVLDSSCALPVWVGESAIGLAPSSGDCVWTCRSGGARTRLWWWWWWWS